MAGISLGMIVRNEGRTIQQCLESVAPHVNEIVIGLGGESTDDTVEILHRLQEAGMQMTVFQIEWTDDFADARNQVLARCTQDYFLWIDGDDILIGGENLQALTRLNPNVDAFYFGYDYARDEDGHNTCFLIRERLIRRHPELPVDWKWVGRVHEVLIPQFPIESLPVKNIVVQHHKPPFKHEGDRNLKILYQQLEESEPNPDPRILAYLGSENFGRGNVREAILHWQRFIKVSGWDEERYQTQVKLSHAYRGLGEIGKALGAAYDAISILPDWPDAYYAIAKAYCSEPLKNYRAALEWLKIGTSKPHPETMLIINPLEYTYEPSMLIAICYTQLGDLELALANYEQGYQLRPDANVLEQIKNIREELDLQAVVGAFLKLREHLGRNDEWLKVRQLYNVVPKKIDQHPAIQETWQRSMQQTAHVLEPQIMVDFYTQNPHWVPMDDERILDPGWLNYPRLAFARSVAERVGAKTIVDWGCSDGFIALPLAKSTGAHVTGFDLDPRCVSLATVRADKWGLDARFEVGNIDEIGGWEGPKADLAIAFEVIEHVVDPADMLRRLELTANHIAITTPYLAWEGGYIPDWDRLEPKGHLRIFDQYDIERLLTGRGQIWNIYKQPQGSTGWIFADYKPGVKTDKVIMIGAGGTLEKWGPRKLEEGGLGGSETAVIKLAEGFANEGHRPIVYLETDDPGYFNGVCYRPTAHFRPEIRADVYIAWRSPEAADWGIRAKKLVLWMHDIDAGDRLTRERAERFDHIVVLTEWHKNYMIERYPFLKDISEKLVVIGNGVDITRFDDPVKRRRNKVIYSSSPDRGLDVILEHIWPKVVEQVPSAELHVYYGWEVFDKFAAQPQWGHLAEFKNKVMNLFLGSKNVVQHGRIPQDQLAKEMQEATIWLYPTYFTETYCITAVEAQLAGAVPITNHLAGLSETVKSGIILNGDVHDEKVQTAFAEAVIKTLRLPKEERKQLHRTVRKNAPAQSWNQVARRWLREFFEKEN